MAGIVIATSLVIYALECEGGKFYVGKTRYFDRRLSEHEMADGSVWTKLHKPIKIVEQITDCDDFDEDKYVLKYMAIYGIDNVRGGSFSAVELDDATQKCIERMIRGSSSTGACFNCGSQEHFTNNCDQNDITQRVEIKTDCDLRNTYYFREIQSQSERQHYRLEFPKVFGRSRNDYEIYLYAEAKNDNMRTIGITLSEYLNMMNKFFDLRNGTYDERTYLDAARLFIAGYREFDAETKRRANKRLSGAIKAVLCKKMGINNVKTIKSWYEESWTQRSEERMATMGDSVLDDDTGYIGFKITFAGVPFMSFVTYGD